MFPDNEERRVLITINGGHALTVLRGPAPQLWPMLLTNGSRLSRMCAGGSATARSPGRWSGPIKSQRLTGTRWELKPLGINWATATQRCQVPSGWTGPSHLLITGPPYWQPALAGGAVAISSAAISRAAITPTMPRFMVASRHIAAGASLSARGAKYRRPPSRQSMTLPLMELVLLPLELRLLSTEPLCEGPETSSIDDSSQSKTHAGVVADVAVATPV